MNLHTTPFSQVTRPDPNHRSSTARAPGPEMADGGSPRVAWVPTGWILFYKTMGTPGLKMRFLMVFRSVTFTNDLWIKFSEG